MTDKKRKMLRSEHWWNNSDNPHITALYLERYMNFGLTMEELRSGKPVIGIAQTGSDLSPCNRIHQELALRVRDGIRDAGGLPLEFPVHPIQETGKRPTASLDRNLAMLGLVEVLTGYPIDGVVLTTGCDKTTPAMMMGAATVDLPSIVLSGGPMLDGWFENELAGSGMTMWTARERHAAGEIDDKGVIDVVCASAPSAGHCNTMGTALSMGSLAEAVGMSLPGSASIPAPYRERQQMAYMTGKRIVDMVHEDMRMSKVLTKESFINAIVVNSAIGGSTNCPIHFNAIARHLGIELDLKEWQTHGHDVPLLVNCQPAGKYLGESFHRAGGVPAVINELMKRNLIQEDAMTVNGQTLGANCAETRCRIPEVIFPIEKPMMEKAGFLVMTGNLFDAAIMKTSVIGEEFAERFLQEPGNENVFEGRAIVFEAPDDYHKRLNDPSLNIDERCILVIRGCGPLGYPGAAEVVNMQPPDDLIKRGIKALPCIGDGRQSGTSASPSILNASPESAAGGNLAILKTDDVLRVDLNDGLVDILIDDAEIAARWDGFEPTMPESQTPWQEIYRSTVGQLATGGCMELAVKYQATGQIIPRDNH